MQSAPPAPEFDFSSLRVCLAVPTYGMLMPECEKSVRLAMMSLSNRGVRWGGDFSTDRVGWSASRIAIVDEFMESPDYGDGLLWVDSDMVIPRDGFTKLIGTGQPFVTGVYHQRVFPHNPNFHIFSKRGLWQISAGYEDNVLYPIDGCGFGLVWTHRSVFNAIKTLPDFDGKWFPDKRDVGGGGEDLEFCKLARKAGVPIFVHTGVAAGHAGEPYIVTKTDWVKANVQIPNTP